MSDLLAELSAANFAEVRQDTLSSGPIFWRVRKLGTAESAAAGVLEGLMGSALDKAAPPKHGRMAGAPDPTITQGKAVAVMLDSVARAAVCGVRREGGEWQAIRLVSPEAEDLDAGRLSVASLGEACAMEVIAAALAGAQGAAAAVAAFRASSTEPANAG
jgi:hypothetical protein